MKLVKFIIIFCIIIFIFIFFKDKEEHVYIDLNNEIKEEIIHDLDDNYISYNGKVLDKYRSEYNNNQIIGILSIANSEFSLLFAKASDNDYYLNHLINKKENSLGAVFIDYRNDIDEDKKINIYGHNNGKSGISFNYIMNYEDREFYDKHKNIIIKSDLRDYIYEVFSVQIVSKNYIHMILDFDDMEWGKYLSSILNNSIYKEDIDIKTINRVLTLQTCTNRVDNEFLLINARLIN